MINEHNVMEIYGNMKFMTVRHVIPDLLIEMYFGFSRLLTWSVSDHFIIAAILIGRFRTLFTQTPLLTPNIKGTVMGLYKYSPFKILKCRVDRIGNLGFEYSKVGRLKWEMK